MNLNQETQEVDKLRRKISLFVLLGVFLTGLITSLSTSLPFYLTASSNLEQLSQLSLERQATLLTSQLSKHQDLAQQFTSRTEIKRRLESFHLGQLSLEELINFSQPRLKDAMRLSTSLLGMQRLTAKQEVFVDLGSQFNTQQLLPWLSQVATEGKQPGFQFISVDNQLVLAVAANIFGQQQELIGQDVLFFETSQLAASLTNALLTPGSSSYLINSPRQEALTLVNSQLQLVALTSAHLAELTQPAKNELVTFYLPLEFSGWGLASQQVAKDFYAPIKQKLALPLLMLILMVLLVGYTLNRLLGPLTYHLAYQAKELKISTAELRLAASVFDGTREAIAVTDAEMNLVKLNGAFTQITGFADKEILGRNLFSMFFQAKGVEKLIGKIQTDLINKASWQGEIWYFNKDGQFLPVLQTISAQLDAEGQVSHYIHIFNDISENKAFENKINYLAHYDQLTDLPNRTLVNQRLIKAVARSQEELTSLAILFMDLDHFKEVNDSLGHAAGDLLLQEVAKRLTSLIRIEDTLGRLGGDEFLLVLNPITSKEDAASVAKKIIQALTQPFIIEGQLVTIGASIGIALCPADTQNADDLIKYADRAMYLAKESGRNTFRYYTQTL